MSTEIISKKRHIELDIARGVAIFLMITQHSWILIFSHFIKVPTIDFIIYILGIVLGAPVFLFIMGTNIINSHQSTPRHLFIRGLKIFFLGYLLSAVRFFLPLVLVQYFGLIDNVQNIIYHWKSIDYLLEIDIFQAAGLSLMAISFLKWRQVKYKYYLIIAFLIALISPLLWQINVPGFFRYLTDPFFGSSAYVLFPLFPVIFYVLTGVYFGNLLSETKNKALFYKTSVMKIIPVFILGFFFLLINPNFDKVTYYRHDFGISLIFVSMVIYWLSFIYSNYQKIPGKITATLSIWSKNVTLIYIVQWLLIAWIAIFISCI